MRGAVFLVMLLVSLSACSPVENSLSQAVVTSDSSSCDSALFFSLPLDLAFIDGITPLGNLNPPEHTLPTQHTYFHLPQGNAGLELRSPGNLTLERVLETKKVGGGSDYGLFFRVCGERFLYFLHVKELSERVRSTLGDVVSCHDTPDRMYEYCEYSMEVSVVEGELLGRVGDVSQHSFDVGLYDESFFLNFSNPSRYTSRAGHILCPLDQFAEPLQSQLYGKIQSKTRSCGLTMQDVVGSLAGNWFLEKEGGADMPDSWGEELSFARDVHDENRGAISIGGVFSDPSVWFIDEHREGFVNRAFSEVLSDGQIYCYSSEGHDGRILVQLIDEVTLRIEHQERGDCVEKFSWVDPFTFYR